MHWLFMLESALLHVIEVGAESRTWLYTCSEDYVQLGFGLGFNSLAGKELMFPIERSKC